MSKKLTIPEEDYEEIYLLLKQTFHNPDDVIYLLYDLIMGFGIWSDIYPKHESHLAQASNRLEELLKAIERGKYDK